MKGLANVLNPLCNNGGRVKIDEIVRKVLNETAEYKKRKDWRKEVASRDTKSFLNSKDFYSVGEGYYCYFPDMTLDEQKATIDREKRDGYARLQAAHLHEGQISFNADGSLEIPEPILLEKEG